MPSLNVCSLAADLEGGLWVAMCNATIIHLKADGKTVVFGKKEGVTGSTIEKIYSLPDGSVWTRAAPGCNDWKEIDGSILVRVMALVPTVYPLSFSTAKVTSGSDGTKGSLSCEKVLLSCKTYRIRLIM